MTRSKYFGDRSFYRRALAVAGPILIQNVITNFVGLLDNIMVGRVGTEPMSGVAIVNQLLFVFSLCIFGGLAGPGIFSAQFYGKGDMDGVRSAFRSKLYFALGAVIAFSAVLLTANTQLISLFLHEGSDNLDLAATLEYGRSYLKVMLLQMLPFALTCAYAGTLRETGETMLPMKAGIIAVFVNLIGNFVLIYGKFGAPALGVVGAAIATVTSRFVELGIVVIWTHCHKDRCPFVPGLYRSLRVPKELMVRIVRLGMPLLLNEVLWSAGMTTLNQCYSLRGLEVVSATNIASTVSNLFFCFFLAMGNAVSIIIGQLLGAGELERAVDEDRKLTIFTVLLNVCVGGVMALLAPLFPQLYNTTDTVKHIAVNMLLISAMMMPFCSFTNCAYFTLRSGGKTVVTFLFDCGFTWVVNVPLAFILSRFTQMPIIPMFLCIQSIELIKCVIGYFLVRSKVWVNNLVQE